MNPPLILEAHQGFYSIPFFKKMGVRALFTTRVWDMALLDKKDEHLEAGPRDFFQKAGIPSKRLVCPHQVHGAGIVIVAGHDGGRGRIYRQDAIAETDALITGQKHLNLGVRTADCLPVFIADSKNRAVAMVHAGWRSMHQKIIPSTVATMIREFDVCADDLFCAFGPALRSCCYEVGVEFLRYFPDSVLLKNKKYYFDLVQEARRQVSLCGVPRPHILDCCICTSCRHQEFFSYRREGEKAGRMMSVIELIN